MPDELSELERLTRVWKDGGLTEEEFQARKAALAERRPRGGMPMVLAVSLMAATFALGYGARFLQDRSGAPSVNATNEATAGNAITTNSTTVTQLVDPTPAEAFAIAFPARDVAVTINGATTHARFAPALVRRVNATTYALVSQGTNLDDTAHAATGFVAITYLGRFPALQVVGRTFYASGAGGFGQAPEVRFIEGLGERPVLQVSGGFTGQGITTTSMDLYRLGDSADQLRVGVGNVQIDYDDAGAGNTPACVIHTRLVPDRDQHGGFTLRYTGSYTASIAFSASGATWTPASAPPELFNVCPARPSPTTPDTNAATPAPAPIPAPTAPTP